MKQANYWVHALLPIAMLAFAQGALAATCTSIASNNWSRSATWSCGHVPTSTDTVVIASGFTVNLNNNFTVAALTINAGGVINDRGNNLTVNGNITVNGTFGVVGGGGSLIANGTNVTISGTGTFADTILEINNSATIAAGSTLNFSAGGQIDVGPNAPPPNTVTLNIAGSVTGTGQTAGNTILNGNGFSSINITGSINAPASDITLVAGDVLTNNGTVSVQTLTTDPGVPWTQGTNSTLTLGSTAGFQGTLNASANGNTVNYPAGTAPIIPSGNTYFNISGPTCPQVAGLTILGTGPCNGGAVTQTVTMSPTLCVNDPGIGTQPWSGLTNVGTQNNIYAQASGINGQISNYLKCTGYNFNIPAGATINGITVGVWRYSVKTMSDKAMQLVKTNVIQPTNLATLTRFPKTNTQVLYGGATNLWGNTWMVADINNAGFGAAFAAVRGPFNSMDTAFVDYMPIAVTYTVTAGPDHIEIDHTGSALTCSPQIVTIKACADAACTTLYTAGGVNVTLTPGGLTFAIGVSGTNNAATVQQSTAGVATLAATSVPAAAGATTCLNTIVGGTASAAACTNAMTFNNSGFLVTVPDHTSCSNATTTIEAVQTAPGTGRCVPAYQSVTRAVNLYTSYVNPATGTLGATTSTGAVSTSAPGTTHNLVFDATGKATITLSYPDAGQLTLTANDTAPTGAAMTGSGSFVVAPASFVFSAVTASPIKAGNSFSATITAMTASGAGTACATALATPNFGKETAPESATLSFTKCQPTGAGSSNGIFTGNVGAFTAGAATAANLNWSEVGNGDLVATLASGSYLGSGLTAAGNTGTSGTVCSAGVGNVGRFIPDHFDTVVTGPMSCPSGLTCPAGGLVYSGLSFTTNVYARNAAGTTTQNYDGTASTSPNFAKTVTLTAWDALGSTTTQNPPAATPGLITGGGMINPTSFSKGSTVSPGTPGAPVYTFGTTPTSPTDIYIRAADTDGVSSLRAAPATSVEGGVKVVTGRMKISNAHGSELLRLPIAITAQFWNGASYVTSTTDSVSSFASGAVLFTNCQKLSATSTWPTTCPPPTSVSPASVVFLNGAGSFILSKPGTGNTGSVDMTTSAPSYLPSNKARATFGVYKGTKKFIYMRENY